VRRIVLATVVAGATLAAGAAGVILFGPTFANASIGTRAPAADPSGSPGQGQAAPGRDGHGRAATSWSATSPW
jgi:hypothetical protein